MLLKGWPPRRSLRYFILESAKEKMSLGDKAGLEAVQALGPAEQAVIDHFFGKLAELLQTLKTKRIVIEIEEKP